MKLQTITIDGFGLLADTTLADLNGRMNVVYGSNGSGKTTLLHCLRGVFCGFDEGRRIGLLPPAKSNVGGGSLQVAWDGDVCRLTRHDRPDSSDRLRVSLLQNDLETVHPRFSVGPLRTDLVPLLFMVGAAEAHAVDRLVQQAHRDGIPLVGRGTHPERLHAAAAQLQQERAALRQGNDAGRVWELSDEAERCQTEIRDLTDQLRARVSQWNSEQPERPRIGAVEQSRRVTWLRNELAAAECDLQEAQDRAWAPDPAPRILPATPAVAVVPATPHRTHTDVQRMVRLKGLDRRIDHARTLLAEAARARLEVALRAAQIAGSDDTLPEPFFKQVRESLKSLEVGILELRDDAQRLTATPERHKCVCNDWRETAHEAVGELSKRLYQLCRRVSRYELRHRKSVFNAAVETIAASELSLLQHLEGMRAERRSLLEATGEFRESNGSLQSKVELNYCECLEHDACPDGTKPKAPQPAAVAAPPIVRPLARTIRRPSAEELNRLRARVDRLRRELDAAVHDWREAFHWRPRLEFPADVRELERRLDEVRLQRDGIETELADCRQRWRVLSITGEVIHRAIEKIERDRQPAVIQWTSQYFQRLTGGRYVEVCVMPEDYDVHSAPDYDRSARVSDPADGRTAGLHVMPDHDVEVVAADGSTTPQSALSRGTRDQLALSLRLALTRAYALRGVRFPLVLDDILVDTDRERLLAAVTLLQEFAREHDQQIVYLTCQTHLADLFELHGVVVRDMPGSSRRTPRMTTANPPAHAEIRGWVDRKGGKEVRPSEPITVERPAPQPATSPVETVEGPSAFDEASIENESERQRNVRILKPLKRRQPDGSYWLSMDAAVDRVPSVGTQMGRRLAGLGIRSIADLIDLETTDVTLRLTSLQITPQRLRDWQAEATLLCCVPDLTGPDAQLLTLLGIRDADHLARADVDSLLRQIDQLSDVQRIRIGSTSRPSRDIIQRWIHNSRRSRSLREARRISRNPGRSATGQRRGSSRRTADRRAVAARGTSARTRDRRSSTRRRRSATERTLSRRLRNRERQMPTRDDQTAVIAPFVSAKSQATDATGSREWRFYLSPESLVVDAPSIGPTTARRLEKIGVITVADLLNRAADDIARRLKNRRIKEEKVRLWQQQSRLMCRIPQLRGHDAQVLVACGVTEPEQVVRMTPEALLAIVGPFVETVEGQRLLRSSKTPDLEEVTDWINWSRHSRHLRAA